FKGLVPRSVKTDGLEVYCEKRFITVTGRRWKEAPPEIRPNPDLLAELLQAGVPKIETPPKDTLDICAVAEALKPGFLSTLRRCGKQLQGSHPVHGSTTGMNFTLWPEGNCFYCFRHGVGGGPVQLAALLLGVVDCEELGKRGRMGLSDEELGATLVELRKRGLLKGPPVPAEVRRMREEEDKLLESLDPETIRAATKPIGLDEVKRVLDQVIVKDDANKLLVFLGGISAYSPSPLNIILSGPSSSGKTYITLSVMELFPPSDQIILGYTSPTAFFHDVGTWDDERKAITVDLNHKLLVFLDQPHFELLERMRPFLSHDKKEILIKITDKAEKKGLRTKNVILKGWPAVFFCAARFSIDEQEKTRALVLSPEMDKEKFEKAAFLAAWKMGDPEGFRTSMQSHLERNLLKYRILLLRREMQSGKIKGVKVPFHEDFVREFLRTRGVKVRTPRDIQHFFNLAKAMTMLNLWSRSVDDDGYLVMEKSDLDAVAQVYERVWEAQESGLPPFLLQVYRDVLLPLANGGPGEGIKVDTALRRFHEVYGYTMRKDKFVQEIVTPLEAAGYVRYGPDPEDARSRVIWVDGIKHLPNQNSGLMKPEFYGGDRDGGQGGGGAQAEVWFREGGEVRGR
ncbi:MAG: hypothetical protein QW356_06005, partial [Candidatus Hadarchaeales archaeon]